MPPPPPALPDELIEEIFLRLPPDRPACLVRASLTSNLWLGTLTGARFRGLYREHHGAPPMLGFIYSAPLEYTREDEESLPYFVAATKFRVRVPAVEDWKGWHEAYAPWDCRHGHVLFANDDGIPISFVVWDPMTGRRRLLYAPEDYDSSAAAVLCNVAGCDHLACHAGPFQVAFVGLYNTANGCVAYGHVSLPEVVQWSKPCSLHFGTEGAFMVGAPPVIIQDAVHFMLTFGEYEAHDRNEKSAILKYDLVSNCLSLIDAPTGLAAASRVRIMALEDGSLGFAHVEGLTLCLWSRKMSSNRAMLWNPRRIVNLEDLPLKYVEPALVGSLEGSDIIFMTSDVGIYEINLKSLQCNKLLNREKYSVLFPYMSFYNPPVLFGNP